MGFFEKIFKSGQANDNFVGDWFSDKNDQATMNEIGDVKMSFTEDGKLTYVIRLTDRSQKIFMTYQVSGNSIITDQPSHPNKEKTDFYFIDKNTLIMKFNGVETRFIK